MLYIPEMELRIESRTTLDNLNHLRLYLAAHPGQTKMSVLINCETGEIDFPHSVRDTITLFQRIKKEKRIPPKWHAQMVLQNESMRVAVQLIDDLGRQFDLNGLSSTASRVLQETLAVLNQTLGPSAASAQGLFSHVESLKLSWGVDLETRRGWHATMGRVEAESLLKGRPVGSYILREGDLETKQMETNLHVSNPEPFRCYILTLVGREGSVSERLLIQRIDGWALYDDNPILRAYTYEKDLISLLSRVGALYPV